MKIGNSKSGLKLKWKTFVALKLPTKRLCALVCHSDFFLSRSCRRIIMNTSPLVLGAYFTFLPARMALFQRSLAINHKIKFWLWPQACRSLFYITVYKPMVFFSCKSQELGTRRSVSSMIPPGAICAQLTDPGAIVASVVWQRVFIVRSYSGTSLSMDVLHTHTCTTS